MPQLRGNEPILRLNINGMFVLKTITCNTSLARREFWYYGSCERYLPPHVNLTRIEYSGKQEETLMSWLITLEDMLAQEDNLY